ncbi:putative ankyrin repeat protein RF_0381 [Microplitis mediator]|uniref:putative ankyrin repeat protein RF_0381 n=1 Tax=Microplitis mediator TaxID=375433 RepID=UPI002553B927|nr:putative ankyrin repeat protein RF_0381 [Microplitis mediator]
MSHNKLDRSSKTLLHDAVRLGQRKVVRKLVSKGANVNARIRNGMTPLHVATKHGYLKIMDYLLRNGADVNARCTGPRYVGFTPLHFACQSENLKSVKLLLKHNASVIPTNDDVHPIHISVGCLNIKITQLLLDYGASMAVNKRFHLDHFRIEGCMIGGSRRYRDEEEPRWRYNDEDLTLLHHTVIRNSIPMAKLLLQYGADVNILSNTGLSPLSDAVLDHNIPMVKLLLNNGALVSYDSDDRKVLVIRQLFQKRNSPISIQYCKSQYSLADKKLEIIKLLIDAGASSKVSNSSISFLFTCIWHGYREIVNYLLYRTDFNFFHLKDFSVRAAIFSENRMIYTTPEIATDTEYITKRKLECKELVYDLLAEKYSRDFIGLPVRRDWMSYQHLTKSSPNLQVTEKEHEDRIKQIKKKVQGVVDELKREKIGDSNITFYHILTVDSDKLIKFGLNEDLRALRIDDYKEKYFIYFPILNLRIRYAINNSLLLEKHNKFVYCLFKNVLPYECCEKIVTYLDNDKFARPELILHIALLIPREHNFLQPFGFTNLLKTKKEIPGLPIVL